MRVRVRPTQLGAKGLLLLLALIASFLATNYDNLFFLLIAFCSALGALGLWWTWSNLRHVTLRHLEVSLAPAGETRAVVVEVAGRHRPRAVSLALVVDGDAIAIGDRPGMPGSEPPLSLPPRTRSLTKVTAVRLTSRFPFGLFRSRLDLPVDAELVTYPAPANARGPRRGVAAAADDDGELPTPDGGRGSAVAGLRPFRSGDHVGDLHWKATARRGVPIVREREAEGALRHDLVLDRRADPDALERALSRLAHEVLSLRGTGRTLVVHAQGGGCVARDDRRSEATALRWLAGVTPLAATDAAPPAVPGARRLPRAISGARHG